MLVCVSSEHCASLPRCIFSGIKRVTQSDLFCLPYMVKAQPYRQTRNVVTLRLYAFRN